MFLYLICTFISSCYQCVFEPRIARSGAGQFPCYSRSTQLIRLCVARNVDSIAGLAREIPITKKFHRRDCHCAEIDIFSLVKTEQSDDGRLSMDHIQGISRAVWKSSRLHSILYLLTICGIAGAFHSKQLPEQAYRNDMIMK